ncbi:MAG: hypothetical protein ACOYW3_01945 [Bacteroidota bacterium]
MVARGLVLFCFLSAMAFGAMAQNPSNSPSSLQPNLPKKVYSPKVSRKKSKGPTYEARDKFYDRMEKLGKQKRKNLKNESNPRYSDFQYFGHKKPPKKRPPEKMKYCKICGIRH